MFPWSGGAVAFDQLLNASGSEPRFLIWHTTEQVCASAVRAISDNLMKKKKNFCIPNQFQQHSDNQLLFCIKIFLTGMLRWHIKCQ